MNELRKNWDFLFPIMAVVVAIIATICNITYGIDTLYDEGSHCLDMLASLNGIPGDDRTWWSDIFLTILGRDICSSVISLRVVKLCMAILTSVVFWGLTHDVAKGWGEKVGYFSVILLFSILTMGGIMVCYNSMSQFLFVVGCGVLYRLCKTENKTHQLLYALLLGCMLTFSLFAVIVSGFVVSMAMLCVILYQFWKSWKELFSILGMMVLGLVLSLTWIHFFAVSLTEVWGNIVEIGQTITHVNRGYDSKSMLIKMILFGRDMGLCVITLVGIYYVSEKLGRFLPRWIASFLFIGLFLAYVYYQEKPAVTLSMLFASTWVMPVCAKLSNITIKQDWKEIFQFENMFNLFLLVLPIIAVLGTVVYIGTKMMWFMIPWAFFAWRVGFAQEKQAYRAETLIALSLLFLATSVQTICHIDSTQRVVESGAFQGMHMTPAQARYFEKMDEILTQYNYERNQSVVLGTQSAMATMCYWESVPCGFYFLPMDFVATANEKTPIPDYMVLCRFDHSVAEEHLRSLNWGWPDEFDQYYIGSPETNNTNISIEQWLYCRKSCKKNIE